MKLARRTALLISTGAMLGAAAANDIGLFLPAFVVWLIVSVTNMPDSVGSK